MQIKPVVYLALLGIMLVIIVFMLSPSGTFGGAKNKVIDIFDSVMAKFGFGSAAPDSSWNATILGKNTEIKLDNGNHVCYIAIFNGQYGVHLNDDGTYQLQQNQNGNWVDVDNLAPTDNQIYDKNVFQIISDEADKLTMDFDGKKYPVRIDSLWGIKGILQYGGSGDYDLSGKVYNYAIRDVPYLETVSTNDKQYITRTSTEDLKKKGQQDLLDIYDGLYHSIRGLDFTINGHQFSEFSLSVPKSGDIIAYVNVGDYDYGVNHGHSTDGDLSYSPQGLYYITVADFKNGKDWTKLSIEGNKGEYNLMTMDPNSWNQRLQFKQLKAELSKVCDES